MQSVLDKISAELADYYRARASAGSEAVQVGWRDSQAQHRRFTALASLVAAAEPFSLNDLGCGLGAFWGFLRESGAPVTLYRGYDMNPTMVETATRLHAGAANGGITLIRDAEEMCAADYSVASGIFSYRATVSEADWLYYVLHTLGVLDRKSTRGFAFNMLTRYSDPPLMKRELYYADPCFMFDYCKRNFSRNVAIRHDYDEYDFTVLVRKA